MKFFQLIALVGLVVYGASSILAMQQYRPVQQPYYYVQQYPYVKRYPYIQQYPYIPQYSYVPRYPRSNTYVPVYAPVQSMQQSFRPISYGISQQYQSSRIPTYIPTYARHAAQYQGQTDTTQKQASEAVKVKKVHFNERSEVQEYEKYHTPEGFQSKAERHKARRKMHQQGGEGRYSGQGRYTQEQAYQRAKILAAEEINGEIQ